MGRGTGGPKRSWMPGSGTVRSRPCPASIATRIWTPQSNELARLSHGFSSRGVGDAVRTRRAPGGRRRAYFLLPHQGALRRYVEEPDEAERSTGGWIRRCSRQLVRNAGQWLSSAAAGGTLSSRRSFQTGVISPVFFWRRYFASIAACLSTTQVVFQVDDARIHPRIGNGRQTWRVTG